MDMMTLAGWPMLAALASCIYPPRATVKLRLISRPQQPRAAMMLRIHSRTQQLHQV